MDVLLLSRLQFAVATMFHFLFVPLTLGLALLVAVMETRYVRTGDETYLKMTRFWGKIFLINFALGVVTGITLEFQFGTNWSRYSAYVGDIFGSLLAIGATAAFFLESTLIGVWVFGWKKISAKAHATVMWLVVFASLLSAVWIIIANGWMQHPVGFEIRNGRAELVDFWAVVFLVASAYTTDLYANYLAYPILFILVILNVAALVTIRYYPRLAAYFKAWIASALTIVLCIFFGVVGLFPNLFPSSISPEYGLTAFNASSRPLTLTLMLVVVVIFVPIVVAYQIWTYRLFTDKITESELALEDAY